MKIPGYLEPWSHAVAGSHLAAASLSLYVLVLALILIPCGRDEKQERIINGGSDRWSVSMIVNGE
jgi:hypothetical protein